MQLKTGSFPIPNGADTVTVPFQFSNPGPTQVLAVVSNTSGDSPMLAISVSIIAQSRTGFTASLSQVTNSSNYVLDWAASFECLNGPCEELTPAVAASLGLDFAALASQPRSAAGDGQRVENRSMDELIAADRYLRQQQQGGGWPKTYKLQPPGAQ